MYILIMIKLSMLGVLLSLALICGCSGPNEKSSSASPLDWSLCGLTLDEVQAKYGEYEMITTCYTSLVSDENGKLMHDKFMPVTAAYFKDFCVLFNHYNVVIFVCAKDTPYDSYLTESVSKIIENSHYDD